MHLERCSFVFMILMVLVSQFPVCEAFGKVDENEASVALADAEAAVVSALRVALEAEEAGANVSGLLVRLNDAGVFLARARMAYRFGDFEGAIGFASSSSDIGVEVENAAVDLRDLTLIEGFQRTVFTVIASVVSMALIALCSLWLWRFSKKHYFSSGPLKVE